MESDDLQALLSKAYFYLKFRPRSIFEMRRWLYKKIERTHWSRSDADKVIEKLTEEGLLDDKKFVEIFVEDRKNLKPKGRFVLKQELLQHGIDKSLVDDYFENNPLDEDKLAEKIMIKYWPRVRDLPWEKRWQKASRFLLRRGFNYTAVKKAIQKMNL